MDVGVGLKWIVWTYQFVVVGEIFLQEIENHVAALSRVAGVHGELAVVIFAIGQGHCQGTKSVPEVVEGEETLGSGTRRLVIDHNERTSQFEHVGQILLDEFVGEMEHV